MPDRDPFFVAGPDGATANFPEKDEQIGEVLAGKYKLIEAIGAGRDGQRLHGLADSANKAGRRGEGDQSWDGLPKRCWLASRPSGKPWR